MRPAQERFVFFVTKILAGRTAAARLSACRQHGDRPIAVCRPHGGCMAFARRLQSERWQSHGGNMRYISAYFAHSPQVNDATRILATHATSKKPEANFWPGIIGRGDRI